MCGKSKWHQYFYSVIFSLYLHEIKILTGLFFLSTRLDSLLGLRPAISNVRNSSSAEKEKNKTKIKQAGSKKSNSEKT